MRSHSEQLCQISDVYDGLRLPTSDDGFDLGDRSRFLTKALS